MTTIAVGMSESVALQIYEARIAKRLNERLELVDVLESDFTTATIELAQWYGWKITHFRPGRTASGGYETAVQGDGKGFPDLIGVREETGHRFVAELKCNSNKKTAEQEAWLNAFEICGIPAFTWYPREIDEIKDVLKNGAAWPSKSVMTKDEEAARKVLGWMLNPLLPRMSEDIEQAACVCASAIVRTANGQKLQAGRQKT